jgi:hypothetical protein
MYELLKIIRRKRRPLIDIDSQGGGICPPVSPSPVPNVSAPKSNSTDENSYQDSRKAAARKGSE